MSSTNAGEGGLLLCYSLSHLVTSIYLTRSEAGAFTQYLERDLFLAENTNSIFEGEPPC
jgi:hypothetical protein